MMIRGIVLLLAGLLVFSCQSFESEQDLENSYIGIPIEDNIKIYYENDSLFYHILLLSDASLDGFWTSISRDGEKSRTQLYLNGVLDTSWVYEDNWPVAIEYSKDHSSIYFVPHDTAHLYQSIRKKLESYNIKNAPTFIDVSDQKFLDITIKRKYVTYYRNGNIDRELFLVNHENLDGFWLSGSGPYSHESRIISNQKMDTTLTWFNDRLGFIQQDEDDSDVLYTSVGGRDEDSIRIVTSIQQLFRKK